MAEQQQPNYFDIEDYQTGKKYRVEAFAEDATYDEAVDYLSTLPEEDLTQYEYTGEPAPTPRTGAVDIELLGDQSGPTENVTAWDVQPTEQTLATVEWANNPKAVQLAESLWSQGVRDPAKYNKALTALVGSPVNLTAADMAAGVKREAYFKARGLKTPGLFTFAEPTGLVDPEAPETVTGSLGSSAIKSVQNLGNTFIGLTALGADLVGADETSDNLLQKYIDNQVAIEYNRPDAVGSLENLEWDNAAQYGAEAIGGLIPDLLGGGVAGFGAKAVAKKSIARAAGEFVEDAVTSGIPRNIAENLAAKNVVQKYTNRVVASSVAGQSIATETGAIYGDTYRDTGEKAPVTSIMAGFLSGSLDSILPTRFLQNMGISGDVTRRAFGRALGKAVTEGVKQGSIEGGTEALQTFIGAMPETWITGELPDDIADQMANAFVQGFIGGKFIGAASSGSTGDYKGPQALPIVDREATIIAPEGRRNSKKYRQGLGEATVRGQEIVDDIVGGWENKPNVQVLPNFQNAGVDKDALGVYRGDGNIILNTEAIVKEAKARGVSPDTVMESVLFHEALGHYGLESLYRENLDAKLVQFYNEGSPEFVRMVDSWIEQNPGAYADPTTGEVDIARAAEEVLAEMSEKGNIPRSMIDELLNMIKDFMRNMGLSDTKLFKDSLKYSERELRTIVAMGQNKVRTGEQVDLSTGTATDKYMYIGTVGASKSDPQSALRLDEALEAYSQQDKYFLEEKDFGPKGVIRENTGWFKAPDGAWRYEIDDTKAIISLGMSQFKKGLFGTNKILPLDQVLDHPELFDAYPELRSYSVTRDPDLFDDDERSQGWFDPSTKTINITPYARNPESVLIHEVQHAVQDTEGFAPGGSPETAIDSMPDDLLLTAANRLVQHLKKEAQVATRTIEGVKAIASLPEYQAYSRNNSVENWEALAKAMGQPVDWAEWKDVDRRQFNAVSELVYTDGSLNFEGLEFKTKAEEATKRHKLLSFYLSIKDIEGIRKESKKDNVAAFEAYEALFGEVEARDTQERYELGFNSEARRKTAPYTEMPSTEGYDPSEYIIPGGRPIVVSKSKDKYARPLRQNKNPEPLTIDELTAEDLFNSLNAYDIVKKVADNYVPTALSLDDLQNEALLRDVPVSAVQKLSVNPGDFTVKLFQYDMVARKLNDKVATLAEKINSGRYTAKDKSDFLKASFAFEDVTAKIFGLQSEYGRALRALQEMEFTNKKVRTLRDALKGLTGEAAALEGMDDPATFEKFARSMAKRIQIKSAPVESSLGEKFASAINTPRAIMSSFDLSAPMRQGIFFIGRKEYYKAWSAMFSGVRAEQNYTDMMKDVMKTEYYPLMSVGKLFISSLDGDLSSREESFQSNFAQNIPGVRRSEVAYAAFLNKLRTDLFTNYVKEFENNGYELATKVDPMTGDRVPKSVDELSEKEISILKALGSFINAGTGRGNLTVGDKNNKLSRMIQAAGPIMNALLFSPGLIASRIRLLNPVWYATLPAPVRKSAIKEAGKFFGGAAMTLGLITMVGAAMGDDEVVEWDIRSSNFLKVNINGVRYDVMGGMAQYMTLFAKGLIHSSNLLLDTEIPSKKTSTGGLVRYEDDFRGRTFFDDVVKFGRYKASPMASFVLDFFDGKNAVGEPFTINGAIASRMMPLYLQDLLDIAEEDGASAGSFASAIPGFFGVGVSRYTPLPLDTEQELVAPDGWDDQELPDGENNFVIVRDGKVILKPNSKRMYEKTVNAFFQELIQYEVAVEGWSDLSPKEQAEIIEDTKRIARQETKKYISPLLGIEEQEEAPVEEEMVE